MGRALEVCKGDEINKAAFGEQDDGEVLLGEGRGCGVRQDSEIHARCGIREERGCYELGCYPGAVGTEAQEGGNG